MIGFLFFLFGTILGSFYLVVGSCLPNNENIVSRRSRCDNCSHKLAWFELIPLFSYIFQLGRCNYCKKKISFLNFFVELASGILFLIGYMNYGISPILGIYLVSISLTIIIFISDMKYMIISDSPLIIGSILIIIFKYFEIGLYNTFIAILYGLLLFITMFLIKKLGDFLFKRESLGGGDIKLAFLMGLVLGYPNIGFRLSLISIIFGSFLALPYATLSVYLNKKNELPFGPFLISSMVIILLFIDKFTRLLVFFNLG